MGLRQIGIDGHVEPRRPAFDPAQHQVLDGVKADRAALQRSANAGMDVFKREGLHQAQGLNKLPLALLAHARFEQPAEHGELFGQVPAGQWGSLAKGIGLVLELLFEVFSQRYERGSTIVTSYLPFDDWTSVFGSERLTGALLDGWTQPGSGRS